MIDSIDPAEVKRLKDIWWAMVSRCHNENHKAYRHYGARGIFVCPEWRESFERFAQDVGARPSPKHSLDRKDNGKGYSPSNCRWATRREQALNRRGNRLMTHMGRTQTITEWCEELNLDRGTVGTRLRRGWPDSVALTAPRGTVHRRPAFKKRSIRGDAKLTAATAIAARIMVRQCGVPLATVAALFGISHSGMKKAVYGQTWKPLPQPAVTAGHADNLKGGTPLNI